MPTDINGFIFCHLAPKSVSLSLFFFEKMSGANECVIHVYVLHEDMQIECPIQTK